MTQKSKYFEIKGYYSDGDEFVDDITYVVKEYDDYDDLNDKFEIFYCGITESDIVDKIKTHEPIIDDFIITSYKLLS